MLHNPHFLSVDWPAPEHVKAVCTTRTGGNSQSPWDSFNLAQHVGDQQADVAANRKQLTKHLALPNEPFWLDQVHGTKVSRFDAMQADAVYSESIGQVCVVLTADCLPVLFTDQQGQRIAAAHAGWRGLLNGILEKTLEHFPHTYQVMAWLGPAIGPQAFEVGEAVRDQFMQHQAKAVEAFTAGRPDHWYADIYMLARQRLNAVGVTQVSGGEFCTYTDAQRFYSYRRDKVTGRMASLIWLE